MDGLYAVLLEALFRRSKRSSLRRFGEIDGKLSMIEYLMADENTAIVFAHTEVPEELEGRGIASRLAKAALEFAKSKELAVIPLCPFVKSYIQRHPEYQPLVKSIHLIRR